MIFFLALFGLIPAQEYTYDEQVQCVEDMEVCQAQVTILVNSLSQVETPAEAGSFGNCDPALVASPSNWWLSSLESHVTSDLYICDNTYWVYLMNDGSYRSTCIAYSNDDFTGDCSVVSDELYCSATENGEPIYGYAGNIQFALEQAIATATSQHPNCPKAACVPLNGYWQDVMAEEGMLEDYYSSLCTYGDASVDQYYYIADENTILNTCVVQGDTWDTECDADAGRVCSAINEGINVVGWPRQQARMLVKAVAEESKAHPQCTTA